MFNLCRVSREEVVQLATKIIVDDVTWGSQKNRQLIADQLFRSLYTVIIPLHTPEVSENGIGTADFALPAYQTLGK